MQMLLETATVRLESVSSASTTPLDHIAINVCQVILEIRSLRHMENAMLAHVILVELYKQKMESQSAINCQEIANVNITS